MAKRQGRSKGRYVPFLLLLFLLFLLLSFYRSNNLLQTEEFTFSSPRLPEAFDGLRIVQLSDLHGREFGEGSETLLAAVRAAKPDLIALTGDLADETSTLDFLPPLLAGLRAIAPCYYITGNHEWAAGIVHDVRTAIAAADIVSLENSYVTLERDGAQLVLAGIDDPNGFSDQKTPEELAEEVKAAFSDPFWILLAHRNNRYDEYGALGSDLILAGHAHGGLIRLPFLGGLIGTDFRLFPDYTDGFYYDRPSPIFVSRGLGNGRTFRLFNRPQLAVLTLTREISQP